MRKQKTKVQPKTHSTSRLVLIAGALLLAVGMFVYKQLSRPVDINLIAKDDLMIQVPGKPRPIDDLMEGKPVKILPNGCYEQQVQCVKAPCPPIMVCPSPNVGQPPNGEVCTQEIGSCESIKGGCITYADGCEKSKICANPYKSCGQVDPLPPTTCQPRPACLDQNPQCKIADRPGMYCPAVSMPPKESPIPQLTGVASFTAQKPCSTDSFAYIAYTCEKDKKQIVLTSGTCTPILPALKKALSYCSSPIGL